jgi:hypothetical protein
MESVVSKLAGSVRRRSRSFAHPAVILPWTAGLALALGAGIAAASIPDGGGVIHGCYRTQTGGLRVIDTGAGDRCRAGENALAWNQQGPKGDQGAQGPPGPQGPQGDPGPPGSGSPTVYQGDIKNQSLVLGARSDPTHIVDTPPLPAGTYLVSYSVGFVLGPADNAVCAAGLKSEPGSNDGVFGVGGNGASESGNGAGGVYGNGVALDAITVTTNGDQISVFCNSGQSDKGTYVGGATIIATPVGNVVTDHQ